MIMIRRCDKNTDCLYDNVTSNGGSDEKVSKSRGSSEGDRGLREQVGHVLDEQDQAEKKYVNLQAWNL